MGETKAAFPERTIQTLKKILYPYMENYENKFVHKVSQIVTTLISPIKIARQRW